jgi:hypothetical protein
VERLKLFDKRSGIWLDEALVYCFWGVQMVAKGFAIDTSNTVYSVITILLAMLAALRILLLDYSPQEIRRAIVIVALAFVVTLVNRETGPVVTALTIVCLKNIDLKNLMKWSFILRGTAFALHFLGVMGGVFEEVVNELGEHDLGFGHSNLAHGEFFLIVASYMLWRGEKFSITDAVIFNVLNLGLYVLTGSKTPMLLVILLQLALVVQKVQGLRKLVWWIGSAAFMLMSAIAILGSFFYYDIFGLLPLSTFDSRFMTGNIIMNNENLTLFGTYVNQWNDLGYIEILYEFGIPWFLFYLIGHTMLIKRAAWRADNALFAYLAVMSLYTMMESYSTSVLYDLGWLYYAHLLFRDTRSSRQTKNGGYKLWPTPSLKLRKQ